MGPSVRTDEQVIPPFVLPKIILLSAQVRSQTGLRDEQISTKEADSMASSRL